MATNLWNLPKSRSAKIVSLEGDSVHDETRRLTELGLFLGQTITCIKAAPFRGPRVYQVSDSVFSLAREVADKIMIEEV